MQLNAVRESWGSDNQTWIGSATGTNDARTVTIDGTILDAYNGVIPSGTPLTETADGKYAPVTAAGDYLAGFLLTPQSFTGTTDVIAPMMWHGRIRANNLPESAFDVRTLTEQNPQFTIEPRPQAAPDTGEGA